MWLDDTPKFSVCLSGSQLLQDPAVRSAIEKLRSYINLTETTFNQYFIGLISNFAEYTQKLPATQHIFYAYPGGFFQLGLDRATIAIKLALQNYQEIEHLDVEEFTDVKWAELFAVFAAALLADLGLLLFRFQIKIENAVGEILDYDPYRGSLFREAKKVAFQFRPQELLDWVAPSSLILATEVLKTTQVNYRDSGFAWISRHHSVLQLWYALMLDFCPQQEDSTRQRDLISLIPLADHELINAFLNNMNGLGANKSFSLFNNRMAHENSENHNAESTSENIEKFDHVFSKADSASLSEVNKKNNFLRYGVSFLAWLKEASAQEFLASNGLQVYGLERGYLAFPLEKLQKLFSAQSKNFPVVSPTELINAIYASGILKPSQINLREFCFRNNPSNQFLALVLPASILLGNAEALGQNISLEIMPVVGKEKVSTSENRNFLNFIFHPSLEKN